MILFAVLGFILVIYLKLYVIVTLWQWIRNGFNFRRVREENAFIQELREEEKAGEKRENERLVQEWEAKRLGY
jgi:hypothetical protein